MSSYKDTVLLPQTTFPMKAGLTENEPARLARWEAEDLYGKITRRRKEAGAPKFILHDGPPFANGDVHMGTALNKLLKDLIVKSRTMSGYYAPFIPGWDCHGLPIEFRVVKESAGLDPVEIRERSEAYARKFIDIQRGSFRRLGVFGDWMNPYLTLNKEYEAEILRTFASLVKQDLVYQSKRPVLWSYGAGTALAEAEVEYKDKTSPAVYVAFKAVTGPLAERGGSFVIWTTTPWTLPANLGIALSPALPYVVGEFAHADGRRITIALAETLVGEFAAKTGFAPVDAEKLERHSGAFLAEGTAQHPFLNRTSKLITGDFVTADTGTGAVHIAPGHGMDDYIAGQANKLGLISPVDDAGCLTEECGVPELVGLHVFKANDVIICMMEESGALLGHETHQHSYPHCWRSKTPVIFRSLDQFFIRIDGIRGQALEEIKKTEWVPAWGENRISGTVEARPDWCISRQRTWGVPLPAFFTPEGKVILDAALIEKTATLIGELGSNAWFSHDDAWWAEQLGLPAGTRKGRDTLDVWIDSGCSSMAVMDTHPELGRPADVYIEATDQHRGWFQSSLMLSVAARGAAPYKKVITHGFVVDNSTGEKISKSGDKPINAEYYYNKYGADIVRLWVASVDYRSEVPFSDELFTQVVDCYRRLRNTLRILLANLHGFDPVKDAVDPSLGGVADRWILESLHKLVTECREAYDEFEFRRVFIAINQFCAQDLSALYIDMTKDRLYCDAADSPRRRATQSAMHQVFETLCRLLAPILAYTADEAWEHAGHQTSIHLEDFPTPDPAFAEATATPVMDRLLRQRDELSKELEKARAAKSIGKSLEAEVTALWPDDIAASIGANAGEIAEIFVLSRIHIEPAPAGSAPAYRVRRSEAPRCGRCWRHLPEVGSVASHPELCPRCAAAL
jgi:isoleucyl-tRNA synthetase